MNIDTEQRLKEAMLAHHGGLGPSLTEEDKRLIIEGRPDEPENTAPFDGDKFLEGAKDFAERHIGFLLGEKS